MTCRPVFVPLREGEHLVKRVDVSFTWVPGLSLQQARKRIDALHAAVRTVLKVRHILEVSTKSSSHLGVELSAFNLSLISPSGRAISVESAYQGSKVFTSNGPYHDLYQVLPLEAKQDQRVRAGGRIVSFDYFGQQWSAYPRSAFYDWLYLSALARDRDLSRAVEPFECFTDIAFNPKKSFNCQARAVALHVSLRARGVLDEALSCQTKFLALLGRVPTLDDTQPNLFG